MYRWRDGRWDGDMDAEPGQRVSNVVVGQYREEQGQRPQSMTWQDRIGSRRVRMPEVALEYLVRAHGEAGDAERISQLGASVWGYEGAQNALSDVLRADGGAEGR